MDYTGLKCPVCSQEFKTGEDIVVCPECGAPYHRSCYLEAGRCIFEEKHGTAEAWQPPKEKKEEAVSAQTEDTDKKRCSRCGKPNSKSALFCDHCGLSFDNANHPNAGQPGFGGYGFPFSPPPQNGQPQNKQGHPPFGTPGQPPIPFLFDPLGGVNPEEKLEDLPVGEVAKLVQNNTPYYLPAFLNIKRFNRSRFNFSAFLFSGGWMLYRKMYKLGAIFIGLMAALYIASLYITNTQTEPLMVQFFGEIGINLKEAYPTLPEYYQFFQYLMQQPIEDIVCVLLPSVLSFAQFGIMLFVGFRGNRLYCDFTIEKMHKIRKINPVQADYEVQLQEKGGVNTSLAICLLICFMVLFYLPAFL